MNTYTTHKYICIHIYMYKYKYTLRYIPMNINVYSCMYINLNKDKCIKWEERRQQLRLGL